MMSASSALSTQEKEILLVSVGTAISMARVQEAISLLKGCSPAIDSPGLAAQLLSSRSRIKNPVAALGEDIICTASCEEIKGYFIYDALFSDSWRRVTRPITALGASIQELLLLSMSSLQGVSCEALPC